MKLEHYKKRCRAVLREFKHIIMSNDYLKNSVENMLKELPTKFSKKCQKDYIDMRQYYQSRRLLESTTIDSLFSKIYRTITRAPPWRDIKDPFNGLPFINVFAKMIATEPGFLFFGHEIVNEYLKKILNLWSTYLVSPHSRYVLTKDGWLGMSTMHLFKIDKKKPYYGF